MGNRKSTNSSKISKVEINSSRIDQFTSGLQNNFNDLEWQTNSSRSRKFKRRDENINFYLTRFSITLDSRTFPIFFILNRKQLQKYKDLDIVHTNKNIANCGVNPCFWCKFNNAEIKLVDAYALTNGELTDLASWIVNRHQNLCEIEYFEQFV